MVGLKGHSSTLNDQSFSYFILSKMNSFLLLPIGTLLIIILHLSIVLSLEKKDNGGNKLANKAIKLRLADTIHA
jgi:hypothetical protein